MAVFIDLDEEEEPPLKLPLHNGKLVEHKVVAAATVKVVPVQDVGHNTGHSGLLSKGDGQDHHCEGRENPNSKSGMTKALGCYPVVMAIASSIDLNALDNLSRTCRQAHGALLQYRSAILGNTLHCANEDLPVDPEDTLRYRARAGNWYYMEDLGRATDGQGKSGNCARDMVAECRRCARVVCRNCTIKPPAPIVLKDRHRRLCKMCTKAPLGCLAKPRLSVATPIDAEEMKRAICTCESEGVWLCQPCGRTIRSADSEYRAIWKWRNQYGDVLGGIGTGIGEADRGVICGRESNCCTAKAREQETDCDAEDARESEREGTPLPWATPEGGSPNERRTPSPKHGPGFFRHEIEGIGGVVKRKLVKMVRVGGCVPEWEEERNKGIILGREVQGRVRSWCGWCWRGIPSKKEYDLAQERKDVNGVCNGEAGKCCLEV